MRYRSPRNLASGLLLAATLSASAIAARAQDDSPAAPPAPAPSQTATEIHVPYRAPAEADITAVLGRVYDHVSHLNLPKVTDSQTKQEITDFATPNQNAVVHLGGYPYGVLHAGMLLAGEVTGDKRFTDYTASRLQLIGDRLPYFRAQADKFGLRGNSFHDFLAPTSLDSCGAWGAAMVKAKRAGVGPDLKEVIDRDADFVRHKQFRLKDGTLARHTPQQESIWADDMYMSIPFLAQMGKLTGDKSYYDDAVRQALQISSRLFDPQKGIYTHGWSADNAGDDPRYYWGRANGWCLMAVVELLDVLPENHPGREPLLKRLRAHARGLTQYQNGDGLWHQLLDKPDSFTETSCSAMFVFGLARAVNRGWISAPVYGPVALAGWNGVAAQVTPDGAVDNTCIGTSYANDAVYYYRRPHHDDQHGYGPVLLAGAEVIRLLKSDQLRVRSGRNDPLIGVSPRASDGAKGMPK